MSSSWYVSADILLESETCLTHCQDGAPHSIQILWSSQICKCVWVNIVTSKATLKAFPSLNNLHVVWVLSFFYVSAWHSAFTVGFGGKQCTRNLPSDPRKLWPWSLLICRIAFHYSCIRLLGHFKVTGAGPVPFDNLQELGKWLFTEHLSALQITL
jgi:hypothetical protein